MVSRRGNRRLLTEFVEQQGHLCTHLLSDQIELLLIDELQARQAIPQLTQLKVQANIVPILLLVHSQSTAGPAWLRHGLVDDLVRMPIAKTELASRLHLALRLSTQSRLANLKLERLVKDARWGVVVLEPQTLRIQAANQAFAQMHGYRPQEMTGMTLAALQCGPPQISLGSFECCHKRQDGTCFPLEMELTYYPADAGPAYYGAFARDIQARKDIEAELLRQHQQVQEARLLAEKASLAKSDFLANISHEIRTPLNGMLATLEMLLSTQMCERQRELAELAHRSSETLLSLVGEVLDFSKIEAGQMQLEALPVDLPALILEVVKPAKLLAEAKNLILQYRPDPRLHGKVCADPLRLRQILQNLLSNAVKFTSKGKIAVNAWSQDSWTCLEVRDQGIGIHPDQQATIFQPFTQADTSTTRRFGGTGLGLAICGRLVTMLGAEWSWKARKAKAVVSVAGCPWNRSSS